MVLLSFKKKKKYIYIYNYLSLSHMVCVFIASLCLFFACVVGHFLFYRYLFMLYVKYPLSYMDLIPLFSVSSSILWISFI